MSSTNKVASNCRPASHSGAVNDAPGDVGLTAISVATTILVTCAQSSATIPVPDTPIRFVHAWGSADARST